MLAAIQRYVPAMVCSFSLTVFLLKIFLRCQNLYLSWSTDMFLADTIYIWTWKIGSLEATWESQGDGTRWRKSRWKCGGTSLTSSQCKFCTAVKGKIISSITRSHDFFFFFFLLDVNFTWFWILLTIVEHTEVHSMCPALQVGTNGCSLVELELECLAHDCLKGDHLS